MEASVRRALVVLVVLVVGVALASAGAARAAMLDVSGEVRGTDGAPLAGAAVELSPVADAYQTAREATSGDSRPRAAKAVSDRAGAYLLRAPGPGMYAVRVAAAGRAPLEIAALPLVEAVALPPAVLPVAAVAAVRVVDADGKPIAGAVLRPVDDSVDVDAPRWRPGWPALRSGADGSLTIPLAIPPPGGGERLPAWTVVAAGFVSRKVEITGPLAIRLSPIPPQSSVLAVRGSDGRPVARAFVAASGGDLPLAATGDDGLARFAPAAGPLAVVAPDGRVWKGRPPKPAAGAPATVTLPPPGALAGGVVDAEDRTPLAGALVASTADLGRFAVADARGSYAIPNPGAGPGERAGLMAWAAVHFRGEAAIPAGARGATLALLPGAVVSGQVVDPGRLPILGAVVEPRAGEPMGFRFARRYALRPAASAADGRFAVLLPPRGGWSLDVAASGFAPRSVALPALAPRARPAPLTVVLDAGRTAVGRVAGPDGEPVAGATVQILPESVGGAGLLRATVAPLAGVPGSFVATSDKRGAFRLQHLPAGRLSLVARKPGYAPAVLPGIEFAAGAAASDLGVVQLLPGAVLEGRVTDGHRPLAGARVALEVSSRTLRTSHSMGLPPVETGADGSFHFADLEPGTTIDLQASHAGFLARRLSKVAVPTGRPLTIALEQGARISGRVLDESGSPVEHAWVSARLQDRELPFPQGAAGSRPTEADGRFTIDGAPGGRIALEARAPGFEARKVTGLEVAAAGSLDDVEIVLKRGAAVVGQVTTDAGLPVAGAEVSAEGSGTTTDGDGAFRIEGVALGQRVVLASHPDLGRASQEVEVGAGETRVDLRLTRGVSLEGRVANRAGEPVAGAEVWLLGDMGSLGRMGGIPGSATSDAQGGFRFENVAPGSYRLGAGRHGGAQGAGRTVEVAGEPLAGLDLVVDPGVVLSGRILGVHPQDLATLSVEVQAAKGESGPAEVAADGSYRLEGLSPGDWQVTASASATGRHGQGRVEIAEGAAEAHLDVELGAGLALAGTVRMNGQPLDGAEVELRDESGQAAAVDVTSHLGTFRLEGLAPGRATLAVSAQLSMVAAERAIDLREGDEERTVDVDIPVGALALSILDAATGRPLGGATVELRKAGEDGRMTTRRAGADAQGHFGLDPLAAGVYALTVRAAGYAPRELQVSVEPQGTATLAVPLSPAAAGAPAGPAKP